MAAAEERCRLVDLDVTDSAEFIKGMDLGVQWLIDDTVDGLLVVAGEEYDWLSAEAARLFGGRKTIVGEGGAAVYMERAESCDVELTQITQAVSFSKKVSRAAAMRKVRDELAPCGSDAMLFDTRGEWKDWPGGRLTLGEKLGDGLSVSAAWQMVAACGFVQSGRCAEAVITAAGMNEQCVAAVIRRPQV